jgi:hypothetical protein
MFRHFVRDWSLVGKEERRSSYSHIVHALETYYHRMRFADRYHLYIWVDIISTSLYWWLWCYLCIYFIHSSLPFLLSFLLSFTLIFCIWDIFCIFLYLSCCLSLKSFVWYILYSSCWNRAGIKVLVPGAGLGRLAFDIAKSGFSTQGNEFSFYMLLASNFILNRYKHFNICFEFNLFISFYSQILSAQCLVMLYEMV